MASRNNERVQAFEIHLLYTLSRAEGVLQMNTHKMLCDLQMLYLQFYIFHEPFKLELNGRTRF